MIFSAIMLYIPPFIMDLTVHVATFSDDFRYKSSVQGFPGSPCLMTPELGSEAGSQTWPRKFLAQSIAQQDLGGGTTKGR